MRESVGCSASLLADDLIRLKRRNLIDGGIFEVADEDCLSEIPRAFLGKIDQGAPPLRHSIGNGVMSGPFPPRVDQSHFGLRLGAFWNRTGQDRHKERATRDVPNGRTAEQ